MSNKGLQKSNPPANDIPADGFMTAFEVKVELVRSSIASAPPPVYTVDGYNVTFNKFVEVDASCILRIVRQALNKNCALDIAPSRLVVCAGVKR